MVDLLTHQLAAGREGNTGTVPAVGEAAAAKLGVEPVGHRNEYGFDEMEAIARRIVDHTGASNIEPGGRVGT